MLVCAGHTHDLLPRDVRRLWSTGSAQGCLSKQGQYFGAHAHMNVAALLCTEAWAYDAFVGPHKRLVGVKAPKLEVVQMVGLAPAHHAGISMQARMWILSGLSAWGALHRALPILIFSASRKPTSPL